MLALDYLKNIHVVRYTISYNGKLYTFYILTELCKEKMSGIFCANVLAKMFLELQTNLLFFVYFASCLTLFINRSIQFCTYIGLLSLRKCFFQ